MLRPIFATLIAAALLAGCLSRLPPQRPEHAIQAPILENRTTVGLRYRSIGPSVMAPNLTLPARDDVTAWEVFGDARPLATAFFPFAVGPTKERLSSYLDQDIRQQGGSLIRYAAPPTVHLWPGTKPGDMDNAVRAVQVLNASLPDDWQLSFAEGPYSGPEGAIPPGNIVIAFLAEERWPRNIGSSPTTLGVHIPRGQGAHDRSSLILVDTERSGEATLNVVVHELIHALGRGHVSAFAYPDSVMTPYDQSLVGTPVLKPLDDAALYAVHSRLSPGAPAGNVYTSLGPWSRDGYAYVGAFNVSAGDVRSIAPITEGQVTFGVILSNGRLRPMAYGPEPAVSLDRNPFLDETASWDGRLVGATPDLAAVAGEADLTVHLARLSGTLIFTELETWGVGIGPGYAGTGRIWGDGDLHYTIQVRENTFIQARLSRDEGVITGGFFGLAHEGMAGTLKRDDLVAAFGGSR